MSPLNEIDLEAKDVLRKMREIAYAARKEKRDLTDKEREEYDDLDDQFTLLSEQLLQLRNGHEPGEPGESRPKPAGLHAPGNVGERWQAGGTTFGDGYRSASAKPKSTRFGRAVVDFLKGRENRDLNSAGGTAILQNPNIANEVFLSLESNNPLAALGAQFINVVNYTAWPIVQTPPSFTWIDESDAVTPDSALVIGSKKIEFANCAALVKVHRFLLEDSAVDTAQVVQAEIIRAIRREMLRVVFHGAAASKEPAGLDEISGVQSLSGATFANFDPIIEAYAAVMAEDSPLESIGAVFGVNTWERLTKLADQNDNPMIIPPAFSGSRGWHYSSVIKENFGTTPYTTRAYVGDFSQLRIGYSGPMSMQLVERYADNLQTAFLVYFRVDVQAIRPANFCRVENIGII